MTDGRGDNEPEAPAGSAVEGIDPVAFARSLQRLIDGLADMVPQVPNQLRALITAHIGTDPESLPSVTENPHPANHANLQLALNQLEGEADAWKLHGLASEVLMYGAFSLPGLMAGRVPGGVAPVEYVNVPIDVGETLPCVRIGLFLMSFGEDRLAMLVAMGASHGPRQGLSLEIVGNDGTAVAGFLERLKALMAAHNVFRGKTLGFVHSEHGGFSLSFEELPAIERDDVILPDEDLEAIEQHTVGIATHAEALLAAGRHLKRGLLLYGPPGTGKTLTVMYLAGQMRGRTTLLLRGSGVYALGQAVAVARGLQPSMVVLEDVDLVAEERTMHRRNPLLFELLDGMDGLSDDADIVFLLTTNRVDLLEPALAARPGRIDQAVEIRLPDRDCRRRLFDLYLGAVGFDDGYEALLDRTEGISAAFVKELARRAVLAAATEGGDGEAPIVGQVHVERALDELLDRSAPLNRAILGARTEGAASPS